MPASNTGTVFDTLEVLPTIGMSGLYSLKAPYSNLLRPQIEYACIAVTNLAAALADGQDPKNDVYIAQGGTEADYDADVSAGRCLITLQSGLGDVVVVPSSALNGLPILDGVRYVSSVLGISLSALPEDFDLSALKQVIEDAVYDAIGVRSTVYGSTVGGRMVLSHETHEAIEAARTANIELKPSAVAQVAKLTLEKQALQARLTQLETYIAAHLPPTP